MKSKRLNYILDLIECDTLVDVGCDHGLLGLNALRKKKANKVIFVDISLESLNKSIDLIRKYELLHKSSFMQTDGLKDVKEPYDLIVIAGIGSDEIIKILEDAKYFGEGIFVPHSKPQKLRAYLSGKFHIKSDDIIEENNRFYSIISVTRGSTVYTEEELFLGLNTSLTKDYTNMIESKYNSMTQILKRETSVSADFLKEFNIIEEEYNTWR